MRTVKQPGESSPKIASSVTVSGMTPSHNRLARIRLMIHWQLGLVGRILQVILPRQDLRMSLKLIGPREDIPRGFQEVGARTTLENEISTLLDLDQMTLSEAQWDLALVLAAACIPPSTTLSLGVPAAVVDMIPERHPVLDTILLGLVNLPWAATEDLDEAQAGALADSEVGSAAISSRVAKRSSSKDPRDEFTTLVPILQLMKMHFIQMNSDVARARALCINNRAVWLRCGTNSPPKLDLPAFPISSPFPCLVPLQHFHHPHPLSRSWEFCCYP